MKLLLVDDERYVIESIKKNICWERTGITEIYTAFTMKQAQEIITAVKMDIIISDIVMPAATGFDLVQWVREQNFRIQVIFLTSYAEFDYARRAIQLESVEYLRYSVGYNVVFLDGFDLAGGLAGEFDFGVTMDGHGKVPPLGFTKCFLPVPCAAAW